MLKIHPTIAKLNISLKAKRYFSELEFDEILDDKVVVLDPDKELIDRNPNVWSFGVSGKMKKCSANDLKVFIEAIAKARSDDLQQNHHDLKMLFALWYDCMCGYFYVSLIPPEWEEFYETSTDLVKNIDALIQKFIEDDIKGRIKFSDLKKVDKNGLEDEEEITRTYPTLYIKLPLEQ